MGLGSSPHVISELTGSRLMPAIAGGVNFGEWWLSLELLSGVDLLEVPFEMRNQHGSRIVS